MLSIIRKGLAPNTLEALAILWSTSGLILPVELITEPKYVNSVMHSTCPPATHIGALSSYICIYSIYVYTP